MAEWPQEGQGDGKQPDAEIIPIKRDTSYEHQLDDDASDPVPVHEGDGIAIPQLGGERRDIVPEHLRTWKGVSAPSASTSTPPGSTRCSICSALRDTWSCRSSGRWRA